MRIIKIIILYFIQIRHTDDFPPTGTLPVVVKGKSFYIAPYPVRCTAQRPVRSNTASPGTILATQQLRAKTKSLAFSQALIYKQLSQLGRQWRERKCPIFETVAKPGIRTRAHLIKSTTFYRWATALHVVV